jgi:hypothetical protein
MPGALAQDGERGVEIESNRQASLSNTPDSDQRINHRLRKMEIIRSGSSASHMDRSIGSRRVCDCRVRKGDGYVVKDSSDVVNRVELTGIRYGDGVAVLEECAGGV